MKPPAPVHRLSIMPTEVQMQVIEIQKDIYLNLLWMLEPVFRFSPDIPEADRRAAEIRKALASP